MFSSIYSEIFEVISCVFILFLGSMSLVFFCCKSKKKGGGSKYKQGMAKMKNAGKVKMSPTTPGGGLDQAGLKKKEKKDLTPAEIVQQQKQSTTTVGGKVAASDNNIKTAAVFTPNKDVASIDQKNKIGDVPGGGGTTAATAKTGGEGIKKEDGTSNKSKKDFKSSVEGVAVPSDDTIKDKPSRPDVTDSWRPIKKHRFKLPEEMTRRNLDDPNYQTWRGLEYVFASLRSKCLAKSDTPTNSKSNILGDSKSNLSSTSNLLSIPNNDNNEKKKKEGNIVNEDKDKKDVILVSAAATKK